MKGQPPAQPSLFACVRLEELIPSDHLLRRIEQAIDFTFIDRLPEPLYSVTVTLPSGVSVELNVPSLFRSANAEPR